MGSLDMTKQEVIRQVTDKMGVNLLLTQSTIESFFEVVKEASIEGEPTYIRTFGSFTLKQCAQEMAHNISQNTAVKIAAHIVPSFKASREFADRVRMRQVPVSIKKEKSKSSREEA